MDLKEKKSYDNSLLKYLTTHKLLNFISNVYFPNNKSYYEYYMLDKSFIFLLFTFQGRGNNANITCMMSSYFMLRKIFSCILKYILFSLGVLTFYFNNLRLVLHGINIHKIETNFLKIKTE